MAFPGTEVLEVAPTAGPLGVGQSVEPKTGHRRVVLAAATGSAVARHHGPVHDVVGRGGDVAAPVDGIDVKG